MTSIGAYKAKTHLPQLMARAEAGEDIVITRHGRPVARLVAVAPTQGRESLVEEFLAARLGRRLEMSVSQARQDGRR